MPSNSSSSTSPVHTLHPDQEPTSPFHGHHDEENSAQLASDLDKDKEKDDQDDKDEEDGPKAYLVDWEPNDQANPRNWSNPYKSWITFQLGMLALSASLGSSITSPAEDAIMAYTHISSELAVLPVSFYILGFAVGPLLWAPVSEVWVGNGASSPPCSASDSSQSAPLPAPLLPPSSSPASSVASLGLLLSATYPPHWEISGRPGRGAWL